MTKKQRKLKNAKVQHRLKSTTPPNRSNSEGNLRPHLLSDKSWPSQLSLTINKSALPHVNFVSAPPGRKPLLEDVSLAATTMTPGTIRYLDQTYHVPAVSKRSRRSRNDDSSLITDSSRSLEVSKSPENEGRFRRHQRRVVSSKDPEVFEAAFNTRKRPKIPVPESSLSSDVSVEDDRISSPTALPLKKRKIIKADPSAFQGAFEDKTISSRVTRSSPRKSQQDSEAAISERIDHTRSLGETAKSPERRKPFQRQQKRVSFRNVSPNKFKDAFFSPKAERQVASTQHTLVTNVSNEDDYVSPILSQPFRKRKRGKVDPSVFEGILQKSVTSTELSQSEWQDSSDSSNLIERNAFRRLPRNTKKETMGNAFHFQEAFKDVPEKSGDDNILQNNTTRTKQDMPHYVQAVRRSPRKSQSKQARDSSPVKFSAVEKSLKTKKETKSNAANLQGAFKDELAEIVSEMSDEDDTAGTNKGVRQRRWALRKSASHSEQEESSHTSSPVKYAAFKNPLKSKKEIKSNINVFRKVSKDEETEEVSEILSKDNSSRDSTTDTKRSLLKQQQAFQQFGGASQSTPKSSSSSSSPVKVTALEKPRKTKKQVKSNASHFQEAFEEKEMEVISEVPNKDNISHNTTTDSRHDRTVRKSAETSSPTKDDSSFVPSPVKFMAFKGPLKTKKEMKSDATNFQKAFEDEKSMLQHRQASRKSSRTSQSEPEDTSRDSNPDKSVAFKRSVNKKMKSNVVNFQKAFEEVVSEISGIDNIAQDDDVDTKQLVLHHGRKFRASIRTSQSEQEDSSLVSSPVKSAAFRRSLKTRKEVKDNAENFQEAFEYEETEDNAEISVEENASQNDASNSRRDALQNRQTFRKSGRALQFNQQDTSHGSSSVKLAAFKKSGKMDENKDNAVHLQKEFENEQVEVVSEVPDIDNFSQNDIVDTKRGKLQSGQMFRTSIGNSQSEKEDSSLVSSPVKSAAFRRPLKTRKEVKNNAENFQEAFEDGETEDNAEISAKENASQRDARDSKRDILQNRQSGRPLQSNRQDFSHGLSPVKLAAFKKSVKMKQNEINSKNVQETSEDEQVQVVSDIVNISRDDDVETERGTLQMKKSAGNSQSEQEDSSIVSSPVKFGAFKRPLKAKKEMGSNKANFQEAFDDEPLETFSKISGKHNISQNNTQNSKQYMLERTFRTSSGTSQSEQQQGSSSDVSDVVELATFKSPKSNAFSKLVTEHNSSQNDSRDAVKGMLKYHQTRDTRKQANLNSYFVKRTSNEGSQSLRNEEKQKLSFNNENNVLSNMSFQNKDTDEGSQATKFPSVPSGKRAHDTSTYVLKSLVNEKGEVPSVNSPDSSRMSVEIHQQKEQNSGHKNAFSVLSQKADLRSSTPVLKSGKSQVSKLPSQTEPRSSGISRTVQKHKIKKPKDSSVSAATKKIKPQHVPWFSRWQAKSRTTEELDPDAMERRREQLILRIEELKKKEEEEEALVRRAARMEAYKKATVVQQRPVLSVKPKKKSTARPVNPDLLVNGKKYSARLRRPKPWATQRLYNLIIPKCAAKFGELSSRRRAEEFVVYLCNKVALVMRRKKQDNCNSHLEEIKKNLYKLGLIKSLMDYYRFIEDYLPFEFRIKAIPCVRAYGRMTGPPWVPGTDLYADLGY